MKLQLILGNRVLVQPLDLVKKRKGEILLPQTGMESTSLPFYQGKVIQVGDGKACADRPEIKEGIRVLLCKGGALDMQDGTRVISLDDVIAVVDPSEPQPE